MDIPTPTSYKVSKHSMHIFSKNKGGVSQSKVWINVEVTSDRRTKINQSAQQERKIYELRHHYMGSKHRRKVQPVQRYKQHAVSAPESLREKVKHPGPAKPSIQG